MREIKFRAWDKNNKTMIYYDDDEGHYVVAFNGELQRFGHGSTPFNLTLPQNLELMQYTGLKDKNGVEIYEGDICRNGDWEEDAHAHNYRVEEVTYSEDEGCFFGWNYNTDGMTCEVIGDIYSNPELLEGKR